MNSHKIGRFLNVLMLMVFVSSCSTPAAIAPAMQTTIASDSIASVIAKYRQQIPQLMQQYNIPGLAIAVVDDQNILWAEGFGFTDTDRRMPITPDTIFNLESMSKIFTASGVLMAVQEGLLDLDEPITTYLPDFTVHSIFEEHPERKITLRHLLSHTAGFTHEAPIGNNFDADAASFEAHIHSISDTWLRFPVGNGYAYSNLGIDLAGYILQKVSGQSYADYQRDHLFQPLGMLNSSFDQAVILRNSNRAVGYISGSPSVTTAIAMVPAGGMYTNLMDMSRFIQFQLNDGALNGHVVLSPELLDEMLTVQFPVRGQGAGCGLTVFRTVWYKGREADIFYHGGFGWGFDSDLWWLPELKLGVVVLANSSDQSIQATLALPILYDLTHQAGPYFDRMMALPDKSPVNQGDEGWQPPVSLAADIAARALPTNPDDWQSYQGEYLSINLNKFVIPTSTPSRVYEKDGALYIDWNESGENDMGQYRLYEAAPGLFFTEAGQAADFRSTPPTFRNIKLKKVGSGPSTLVWSLLAICGLMMLSVLLVIPLKSIWWRIRRRGSEVRSGLNAKDSVSNVIAIITSLCGLASIGLLVVIPRIIYSGFLGWLPLPVGLKLLMHAPLGLAVCVVGLSALVFLAWQRGWWMRRQRWYYTMLALAALAETALLASWRLIGFGYF